MLVFKLYEFTINIRTEKTSEHLLINIFEKNVKTKNLKSNFPII